MTVNLWMSWMSILDKKNENTLKNAKNNKLKNTIYQSVNEMGPWFYITLPAGAARPLAHVSYATAGSANLYDIVANLPEGPPI